VTTQAAGALAVDPAGGLHDIRAHPNPVKYPDQRALVRRVSGDLQDIPVKALEQGVPDQTLIASAV
jgi:hypothetical protein